MKENEIDKELEKVHIEYERLTEWYAYIDLAGTLYAVADTSKNFGLLPGTGVPKSLKTRKLQVDDEIFAYDSKYVLDPLMQIRYGRRMKYSELPADYLVHPGNVENLEAKREKILKGVLI